MEVLGLLNHRRAVRAVEQIADARHIRKEQVEMSRDNELNEGEAPDDDAENDKNPLH